MILPLKTILLVIACILNCLIATKETLKLIAIKNQAYDSNNTVASEIPQTNKLLNRKESLSVVGKASGVIKSNGFRITAKIKIEDSTEDLTKRAYRTQITELLKDLNKLNVTLNQVTFLNYKLQRECQTCFLIQLKPLSFSATADLSIESDHFYLITKLLESKNYLYNIEVFMRYDYDNLLKEIKEMLSAAVENGISEAQRKLENKNKEIKRVLATSISVNSINTIYNYKNEDIKLQYADKFLKHQFVDFMLKINFQIGNKDNPSEEAQSEFYKKLQESLVNSVAVNALNAYVES